MEWKKRLDRTSSLPPPWERNAGAPAVIAQPASARAPSVSESRRSGQALMHWSCRQAEPCPSSAQTCLTGPRSAAGAAAVSHRTGGNHCPHVHIEIASKGSEVAASEASAHDSPSGDLCSSQKSGKPLHRLQVFGQHILAQGQPQADLQPVGLSLAPQRQLHDSASCHSQEQDASSPAHLADGKARAQCSGIAAAVAAAEGGLVALMTPDGSWASGVVVSAEHGYIVTVAHLLRRQTATFRRAGPACQQHGPSCREQPRCIAAAGMQLSAQAAPAQWGRHGTALGIRIHGGQPEHEPCAIWARMSSRAQTA